MNPAESTSSERLGNSKHPWIIHEWWWYDMEAACLSVHDDPDWFKWYHRYWSQYCVSGLIYNVVSEINLLPRSTVALKSLQGPKYIYQPDQQSPHFLTLELGDIHICTESQSATLHTASQYPTQKATGFWSSSVVCDRANCDGGSV